MTADGVDGVARDIITMLHFLIIYVLSTAACFHLPRWCGAQSILLIGLRWEGQVTSMYGNNNMARMRVHRRRTESYDHYRRCCAGPDGTGGSAIAALH